MSTDFPEHPDAGLKAGLFAGLDPWKAAAGQFSFNGEIPLAEMPRLTDKLARNEGSAEFNVRFAMDNGGRPQVHAEVKAAPWLLCQRTLRPFAFVVNITTTVVVVRGDEEAEQLADDIEPVLASDGHLVLAQLVEEELLLALPLVPLDPGSEALPDVAVEDRQTPFSGLADMLRSTSEQSDDDSSE